MNVRNAGGSHLESFRGREFAGMHSRPDFFSRAIGGRLGRRGALSVPGLGTGSAGKVEGALPDFDALRRATGFDLTFEAASFAGLMTLSAAQKVVEQLDCGSQGTIFYDPPFIDRRRKPPNDKSRGLWLAAEQVCAKTLMNAYMQNVAVAAFIAQSLVEKRIPDPVFSALLEHPDVQMRSMYLLILADSFPISAIAAEIKSMRKANGEDVEKEERSVRTWIENYRVTDVEGSLKGYVYFRPIGDVLIVLPDLMDAELWQFIADGAIFAGQQEYRQLDVRIACLAALRDAGQTDMMSYVADLGMKPIRDLAQEWLSTMTKPSE